MRVCIGVRRLALAFARAGSVSDPTVALWPFDEQKGIYPSSVLADVSANNYPLVLGPGGQIVEGKFGNALEPLSQPPVRYPAGPVDAGLAFVPAPAGRSVEPLTWSNARFCALMTRGENHLRKEVTFPDPTRTKLNLGNFDWTVEFWYQPTRRAEAPGVVFEIGPGPRGENDDGTRLLLETASGRFVLENAGARAAIPTDAAALDAAAAQWHHFAFVFSRADSTLRHYVDGKEQRNAATVRLRALAPGDDAYFTIGRDGRWERPLAGRIDELRFSEAVLYSASFAPPASFSPLFQPAAPINTLQAGPPLLFEEGKQAPGPIPLLGRKHLLVDASIAERLENITFTVNPPRRAERVIDTIKGPFRKHLTVVEDEAGLIRMYYGVQDDHLAVLTSRDGVHWEKPVLAHRADAALQNVVVAEPTATGVVFIDPNGPAEERWKFVTGYEGRGIYLYTSRDGWAFRRHPIALLPFRAASQSAVFYDEQRQLYVGYHRTDYPATPDGKTQREFVRTETNDVSTALAICAREPGRECCCCANQAVAPAQSLVPRQRAAYAGRVRHRISDRVCARRLHGSRGRGHLRPEGHEVSLGAGRLRGLSSPVLPLRRRRSSRAAHAG
jgi:hypothetical protein